MAWMYLVLAGVLEVGWAIGLKYTEGWTKLYPSIFTFITLVLSFAFLSIAVKTLPVGTAYAVWTGIGAVGTAALGIFLFNEPSDWSRVGCILLIVAGIIGLKLTSSH